ncbi:MAG: hypothetical protein ACE15E_04595 [Acidobacteriota bacterium]
MFDFGDPRTVWLNVTNVILGLVTLVCLVLLARALIYEVRVRRERKTRVSDADHVYAVEGLGLTMADGGEKVPSKKK